jgi:lipoate-protein ligase B
VNVAMDLDPWHRIRPCGLSPEIMSDLTRAAGRPITMAAAAAAARAAVLALTASGDPV